MLRTISPVPGKDNPSAMGNRMTRFIAYLAALAAVLAVPVHSIASKAGGGLDGSAARGLRLRLAGTAVADDPTYSLAVMESGEDGRQRSYHEGDFAHGMRIIKILRNKVILRVGGNEAIMALTPSTALDTGPSSEIERPAPISHGPRPPMNRRHDTRYIDRDLIAAALSDIDGVMQTVRVEAVTVYGKPVGIRISPVAPGSVFSDLGLRAGDIIQEVNGAAAVRPEQVTAILRGLQAGKDLDIKVKGRRTRVIHLIMPDDPEPFIKQRQTAGFGHADLIMQK
jgi:general secretion pathway protein C